MPAFSWSRAALCATAVAVLSTGAAFGLPEPIRTAMLVAPDDTGNLRVGGRIAVSGDTLLVAAHGYYDATGAVYVYVRDGAGWSEPVKLVADDVEPADGFGTSVAIHGDTAVVGAPFKDDRRGAAYVYTRVGATWTQTAKLVGAAQDDFGAAVALSGDTLVVGADTASLGGFGGVGAAYVFVRDGATWTPQAKLSLSFDNLGSQFGKAVAISGDTIVVGANVADPTQRGALVFTRDGGTWRQSGRLAADEPIFSDYFGNSVSLDGDTAIVGDPRAGDFDTAAGAYDGAASVYRLVGGEWRLEAKLRTDVIPQGAAFGASVHVAGDMALVGAEVNDGAAFVFTRSGSRWTLRSRLAAESAPHGDFFGASVALAGDTAVVGAPNAGTGRGAVYVFDGVTPPRIDPYVAPVNVVARVVAAHPERSTLLATGVIDGGPDAAEFAGPATLSVGGFHFDIPSFVATEKTRAFVADGVTFTLTPAPTNPSHAAFRLKIVGDLAGKIDVDGPIAFEYADATFRARGAATLAHGRLPAGGLRTPGLSVVSAHATLRGDGMDKLSLALRFAPDGVVPAVAENLTLQFGNAFDTGAPASSFRRRGGAYVLVGRTGGITRASIDYRRGTIVIAGARLDLGTFAEGPNAVVVTVGPRAAHMRMTRVGDVLTY